VVKSISKRCKCCCFVGGFKKFPTATHRDGVCIITVAQRIMRVFGTFNTPLLNLKALEGGGIGKYNGGQIIDF